MSETSGSRGPQLRVRLYWHTLVPSEVLAEEEDAPLAVMLADAGAPTVLAPGHLMQICRLAPVILAHWRLCWQMLTPPQSMPLLPRLVPVDAVACRAYRDPRGATTSKSSVLLHTRAGMYRAFFWADRSHVIAQATLKSRPGLGWNFLLARDANPPFSVFLSIHGTAGPGVTPGRILSLHCPSRSYSGHPVSPTGYPCRHQMSTPADLHRRDNRSHVSPVFAG